MDDDEPLPAPPEFDGNAGRVPDLLDADDVILDDAEVLEDPELLDSALVTMRPHSVPPPIPAPLPGSGSRSFVDDGEIALPPQISRYVQNFPFRKVRAEPEPSAAAPHDDEASPDTAGWRSAALHVELSDDDDDDDVTDELEPDELDAEEIEAEEDEVAAAPESRPPPPRLEAQNQQRDELRPVDDDDRGLALGVDDDDDDDDAPPARTAPPLRLADQASRGGPPLRLIDAQRAAAAPLRLVDDDDEATGADDLARRFAEDATVEAPATPERVAHALVDDDDAPLFVDAPPEPAPLARAADTATRWQFADLDRPQPAPTRPSWSDDEPVSADMFGAQLGVEPEAAPVALVEASRDPARMFSDESERAAETFADGEVPDDDDVENGATGMFRAGHHRNDPTGLIVVDTLPADDDDEPPPQAFARPTSVPPDDDDARALDLPDDDEPPPQRAFAPPTDDDDDEPLPFQPSQPSHAAAVDDDDEPLPSQPSHAAAVDDDDEPSHAASVDDDDAQPSNDERFGEQFDERFGERLRDRGEASEPDRLQPRPIQTSGAIMVDPGLDDDDDEWVPTVATPRTAAIAEQLAPTELAPVRAPTAAQVEAAALGDGNWIATRPGASMASGVISVADLGEDDDDEWVPQPPAPPQAEPAPLAPPTPVRSAPVHSDEPDTDEDDTDEDDDDEWEPQSTAVVGLAPAPTDLGEPFPLDLWSDPDELIGRTLGRYELVRPLSRGMTTRVYAAQDTDSGRAVAVRVLGPMHSPADPRARQFIHEAQRLARLRSEHIVEVLDTGTTSDHLSYYVMEHLAGDTLASALRSDGPLHWAEVAAFANQICDALILASERGVVHTDLSASTCVRLRAGQHDPEGERRRDLIKLLDVGVAPLTSGFRNNEGTWTLSQGTPLGAAEFMAPEVAGGGKADARTTVYALGVLMYELATGRPPFRGDSFISVLKKQMYEEPVPLRQAVPDSELPEVFEAVVLKALAKAPGDRYTDLRALDEALLAARAREGELRRVTQILALDPAFWDEDGSRRVKAPSAPLRAAAEPTPLATFAADLKQNQPELAAAVFNRHDPRREPSTSLRLSQLAPAITAPELPPLPVMPVMPEPAPEPQPVYALPPRRPNSSLFRTVSLSIVASSVLLMLLITIMDRNRGNPRKPTEVTADSKRSAARPPARDPKPRPRTPVVAAVADEPKIKPAPPPEPEVQPAPPPEPEPVVPEAEPPVEAPPVQALVPEVKAVEPPAQPPVNTVAPVKPAPVKPAPVKPAPVKPPVKPTAKPAPRADDVPLRIEPIRLQSRLKSMEERVATRCRSRSGVPNPRGLKVSVRVVVDVRGEVKANATGAWAGTPMGQCIEEMLEAIRFNETHNGGSRTHVFTF